MVQIVVKRDEEDQFMVESSLNINVDQLTRELVAIHNLRTEIRKSTKEIKQISEKITQSSKSEETTEEPQDNLYTRTISDSEAFTSKVIVFICMI
jgi:CII-binding regulator of phage lambda lysogenization HflD